MPGADARSCGASADGNALAVEVSSKIARGAAQPSHRSRGSLKPRASGQTAVEPTMAMLPANISGPLCEGFSGIAANTQGKTPAGTDARACPVQVCRRAVLPGPDAVDAPCDSSLDKCIVPPVEAHRNAQASHGTPPCAPLCRGWWQSRLQRIRCPAAEGLQVPHSARQGRDRKST